MFKKFFLLSIWFLLLTAGQALAQQASYVTNSTVTMETDGTNPDGSVNLQTNNAGRINFLTNRALRGYIDGTTGALTGFALGTTTFTTLTGTANPSNIGLDTADAADNKQISISGGGASANSRGAYINLAGNESAGGGELALVGGNAGGGRIALFTSAYPVEILTNSLLRWSFGSSGTLTQDATNGGDIVLNKSPGQIRQGTSDAADDRYIAISGGGTEATTRGAYAQIFGNEFAAGGLGGSVRLQTGNVATGYVYLTLGNASGLVKIQNSSGNDLWTISNAGKFISTSTLGTDIGWTPVNAANQACNTTCSTGCVFGMNTGALGNFVSCTDATADTCICAGAS